MLYLQIKGAFHHNRSKPNFYPSFNFNFYLASKKKSKDLQIKKLLNRKVVMKTICLSCNPHSILATEALKTVLKCQVRMIHYC